MNGFRTKSYCLWLQQKYNLIECQFQMGTWEHSKLCQYYRTNMSQCKKKKKNSHNLFKKYTGCRFYYMCVSVCLIVSAPDQKAAPQIELSDSSVCEWVNVTMLLSVLRGEVDLKPINYLQYRQSKRPVEHHLNNFPSQLLSINYELSFTNVFKPPLENASCLVVRVDV